MRGHIRRRTQGSWAVVVDFGRDPQTSKRRQLWRSVKGTKRDAEVLLAELLYQRQQGIDGPPGRLTVADYLSRWLETYATPNTAPATSIRYEQLTRLYVVPVIGHLTLVKLRPLHIQQIYAAMLDRGLSRRTALQAHRVLREALKHAVRWQLISRNPADAVEPPRGERYEATVLTPDDARRLLAVSDETPYGTLVHVAIYTGLRLSELTGLRWQDVDSDRAVLHVRQTCQWLPRQGFSFRQPKSYRGTRPVALALATIDRLRQHRLRQLEERLAVGPGYRDHDLVFADPVGQPVLPSNLRAAWKRIRRATALHVRVHDLRHAHATFLLAQGVHPKIVSERLGHSQISITLDLYSHTLPHLQAEAAAGFADWLANG